LFVFKCRKCNRETYRYKGRCCVGTNHFVLDSERNLLQKDFPNGPTSFLLFKWYPHLVNQGKATHIEFSLSGKYSFKEGFLLWGLEHSDKISIKECKFNPFPDDTQGRIENVLVKNSTQEYQFQGRDEKGIMVSQIYSWHPYDSSSNTGSVQRLNVSERRFDITG
jgi:hypothetical protein